MTFYNPFRFPTADTIRKDQLKDAELNLLLHEAAQEHHAAMAGMYRARVARLGGSAVELPGRTLIGANLNDAKVRP